MVAMDNYNGFKPKQVGRQAQMFSSPWLTNRIQKMNTNAVTNDWARLLRKFKKLELCGVFHRAIVTMLQNLQLIRI